jgi:hypothetical protein
MPKPPTLLTDELAPAPIRAGLEELPAIIRVRGESTSRYVLEHLSRTRVSQGCRSHSLCRCMCSRSQKYWRSLQTRLYRQEPSAPKSSLSC